MTQYDLIILVLAFSLGYYIDNYETHNLCPPYCEIDHKHRVKRKGA